MTKKFLGVNLKRKSLFFRLFRVVVSVVVLSALLIAIALTVRAISEMSGEKTDGLAIDTESILSSNNINIEGVKKINEQSIMSFIDNIVGNIKVPKFSPKNYFSKILNRTATKVIYTEEIEKKHLFNICIFADIHEDFENLTTALSKAQENGCAKVFVIGDLSNYGDIKTLTDIKNSFAQSEIEYYPIPGDHDLAQSVGIDNYIEVFKNDHALIEISGITFMTINNSANYTKIDNEQMYWIESNINSIDYIVLSQPVFVEGLNSPFNFMYMGSLLNPPTDENLLSRQREVQEQGKALLKTIRNSNVIGVFSGEHHRSSRQSDPERATLTHYVCGAITSVVNDYPQNAIQSPRFCLVKVFDDKSVQVEDILIE